MNKLIIKNVGYDFHEENIKKLTQISPKDRLNILYILPNYSLLEKTRIDFAKSLGATHSGNIMTFDDLAEKFSKSDKRIINRNEGSWIIKKIVEDLDSSNFSTSLGTSREIFSYILFLKSNMITSEIYKMQSARFSDIASIASIYENYEDFLVENNLEDEIDSYLIARNEIDNLDLKNQYELIITGFLEFRPHELELIKSFSKRDTLMTVQYPFKINRANKKILKMQDDFRKLGFYIEEDEELDEKTSSKLAYDVLSVKNEKYNLNLTEISASTKYYEIREIFSIIKSNLELLDLDEISIIADEDYEDIIKSMSKELDIPISIMNEVKGRDLPLIRSIINLLEFAKGEEKGKLISLLLDDNLNQEFVINKEFLLGKLREIDYKGVFFPYSNLDNDFEKFIIRISEIVKELRKGPCIALTNYFKNIDLKKEIVESYSIHKDIVILKDSLRSLNLIESSLEEVTNFSRLLNLDGTASLELLIDTLKDLKYYTSDDIEGVQVLKPINSIGSKSKLRFICGLNSNFPQILKKGYLYNEKFYKLFDDLDIAVEDMYEAFDKSILIFAQNLAGSKDLVLSYLVENPESSDDKSILLKDVNKRISPSFFKSIQSYSMIKKNIGDFDTIRDKTLRDINSAKDIGELELNYLSKELVERLNKIAENYYERKSGKAEFWGNINTKLNLSNYSPKMLEFYNSCPYKFYMKYILKIEPFDLDYKDEFNLDKGNYYHNILKTLYEEDVYSLTDENLRIKLQELIDFHLSSSTLSEAEIEIQKSIYMGYLYNFVIDDILFHEKMVGNYIPKILEGDIHRDFGNFTIKGKVDRVDYDADGNYIVIDYKSSSHPNAANVKELKKIQLPIYSMILGSEKVKGLLYGSIQDGVLNRMILHEEIAPKDRKAKVSGEFIEEYFDKVTNLVNLIHDNINKGIFTVNPISEAECKNCEYADICMKEELVLD